MPDPNDFGLLPRLLRSATQSQNRLPTPQQMGGDFRLAGTLGLLEILKDPVSLLDNITATAVEAANIGMRQGFQAGIQTALQRGSEILRELPAYAPLGAEPKFSGGWSEAARAAGYVDNPEQAGAIMSLLAPTGLPARGVSTARPFSVTNAMIDARRGSGLDEVRELAHYYFQNRNKVSQEYGLYFNKVREWRDRDMLIAYRSAGQTGYGTEGVPDIVFSSMFPDVGKKYAKDTDIPGVMGWRVPREARIFQYQDDQMTLEEATKQALEGGFHIVQRSGLPHELILTKHFFNDFKPKPEAVRMTGSTPITPLAEQPRGGQADLGQFVAPPPRSVAMNPLDYLPPKTTERIQRMAAEDRNAGRPFRVLPPEVGNTILRRGGTVMEFPEPVGVQRIQHPDRPTQVIAVYDSFFLDELDSPLTRDFALKTGSKYLRNDLSLHSNKIAMHPGVGFYESPLYGMVGSQNPRFSELVDYWRKKGFKFEIHGNPIYLANPSEVPHVDRVVPLQNIISQIAPRNQAVFFLNGSQLEALRRGQKTYSVPVSTAYYTQAYRRMAEANRKIGDNDDIKAPVIYIVVPTKRRWPVPDDDADWVIGETKNWQAITPKDIKEVYAIRMIARIPDPRISDDSRAYWGTKADIYSSLYGATRITPEIVPPRSTTPTGKAPNPQNPRPTTPPSNNRKP